MWGEAKETRSSDKKEDMPSRHVCKDVRPLLEKMTMMTMMTMTMMKKMMMMMMKMKKKKRKMKEKKVAMNKWKKRNCR